MTTIGERLVTSARDEMAAISITSYLRLSPGKCDQKCEREKLRRKEETNQDQAV